MERIAIQLTPYEKLQILRDQRQEREQELVEIERTLKEKQRLISTRRYLESLSPYYAMHGAELPAPEEIDRLEERRNLVKELIDSLDREIPEMVKTAESAGSAAGASGPATPSAAGPARKAKFDF